jgi:hypothetical protein
MATFSASPKLAKGAIVGFDLTNPLASVILFQYNPKTVTRRLEGQFAQQNGARAEATRLRGAPTETIDLQLELDATDQLERGDAVTEGMGIYPQLAALEMLLYPKSATVILNTVLLAAGTIEIVQPEAPFTLFIWGVKRVLPVRITGFSITEQEFDSRLNPIRATVPLSLRVLNYNDFSALHPGYALFLAHQVVKETMAVIASANNLSSVAGADIRLF